MDTRLLRLYEEELRYLRAMGGEFAREYPKVAGRLALDGFECADPYVERLLEGVAFLTARIQLKLGEQFPDFTRNLLDVVHPQLACPVPSMAVVELEPDLTEGALAEGFPVPRGTILRSVLGKGEKTACEYRTAHPITLWPLQITGARYLPSASAIAADGLPQRNGARAALRLHLQVTAGAQLADLALDTLPVYLPGNDEIATWLYEQIFGACVGFTLRGDPAHDNVRWLPAKSVRQLGFEAEESLLPSSRRGFEGYRLLQEYFAFPQRYLFFELGGMAEAIRELPGAQLEITLYFDRADARLDHAVQVERFGLFASPVVNLFPMTTDRIHLNSYDTELHVVP
ncbi:MAG: type VI secretion system baseplate subunit TssF, partial [Nitrococcus sp.]|nr:type VI secretion system baseplate subunit TssF [Nitrococcus sp.]